MCLATTVYVEKLDAHTTNHVLLNVQTALVWPEERKVKARRQAPARGALVF